MKKTLNIISLVLLLSLYLFIGMMPIYSSFLSPNIKNILYIIFSENIHFAIVIEGIIISYLFLQFFQSYKKYIFKYIAIIISIIFIVAFCLYSFLYVLPSIYETRENYRLIIFFLTFSISILLAILNLVLCTIYFDKTNLHVSSSRFESVLYIILIVLSLLIISVTFIPYFRNITPNFWCFSSLLVGLALLIPFVLKTNMNKYIKIALLLILLIILIGFIIFRSYILVFIIYSSRTPLWITFIITYISLIFITVVLSIILFGKTIKDKLKPASNK